MTDQVIPTELASEGDAPRFVSAEEYLEKYAHDHYEWDNGELIKLTPVTLWHARLNGYLYKLLEEYFAYRPIGIAVQEPYLMRVDSLNLKREPDLQVILNGNPGQLTATAMLGPADICIEIVSPESIDRDFGQKYREYEAAGVREYWILDYIRREARFHRLGANGRYVMHLADSDGNYETPLLPDFKLHVPTLWSDPLPNSHAIADSVRAMLNE
jgi:Uma2 family endonuclease